MRHSPSLVKLFQYFTPFNHAAWCHFFSPPCARSRARKYPSGVRSISGYADLLVDFLLALFFLFLFFLTTLLFNIAKSIPPTRKGGRWRGEEMSREIIREAYSADRTALDSSARSVFLSRRWLVSFACPFLLLVFPRPLYGLVQLHFCPLYYSFGGAR